MGMNREYVQPAVSGWFVSLGAAVREALEDQADLYVRRDGRVLALVNCREGELSVTDVPANNGMRRVVWSRILASCLRPFQRGPHRHVPARCDLGANALLMGDVDPDTVFSPEGYIRIETKKIRCLTCQISGETLRIKRVLRRRSEVRRKDGMLAFFEQGNGSIVLERDGDMHVIRKPEVVSFAREHWFEKDIYCRRVDGALVVSADIRALSTLENLEGFHKLTIETPLTLEMGRYFQMWVSAPAVRILGERLAAYACGDCFALAAEEGGDIDLQNHDGTGYMNLRPLYQQILTRYPGAERLFLIPHGCLLVLSPEREPDTGSWPPPDYFCRLLMKQIQGPPLMRSGAYSVSAAE